MNTLRYPLENPVVSQVFNFDNTNHPYRKGYYNLFDKKHPGVDFSTPVGTKVYASYPGIVVRKEIHPGMGKVVGSRNGNIVILYAHLSRFNVKLGQILKQGDLVGLSGDTGEACGEPHLHFEIRDITKQSLKKMVFNPPFNKAIKQFKSKFTYWVNNQNTEKSFKSLAKLYFGDNRQWKTIRNNNEKLKCSRSEIIPDTTKIVIPNYN